MKVEFVSGKGGVGKSAVSAALARSFAQSGEKVLAVSMIPGSGLGAHLGAALGPAPAPTIDGVQAMEVRRIDALEEYVRLYSPVPALARLGRAVRAFDSLATAAPGLRELITVGKILHDAREWDRVVVDAVPTGQIASYLTAPDVIADLVHTGRVAEQTESLRVDLRASVVHLVTIPEELPVTETLEAIESFGGLLPSLGRMFINRVMSPLPALPSASGPILEAALLQQSLADNQAGWITRLPAGTTLPFLFGAVDPVMISGLLSTLMEAPS